MMLLVQHVDTWCGEIDLDVVRFSYHNAIHLCLVSSVGFIFMIILKSLIVVLVIGEDQSMLQQAEHPRVIEFFRS